MDKSNKPKRPTRPVQISAKTVNVKRSRRRRRRNRVADVVSGLEDVKIADVGPSVPTTIREVRQMEMLHCDDSALGWFYKYMDPAGATETGRAMGEYGKIPDGTVKFSVDAEIRTLYNESVPETPSGEVHLNDRLWSCVFVSLPAFRSNYLVIANVEDKAVSTEVAGELCAWLNNLGNWREIVDSQAWFHFSSDETWYVRIRTLPPTYDIPDPTEGMIRTVTDYRLTYKGMTVEMNAPDLLNQGYWAAGHYAISGRQTSDGQSGASAKHFTVTRTQPVTAQSSVTWSNLPQGGTYVGDAPAFVQDINSLEFAWRNNSGGPPPGYISYVLPTGRVLFRDGNEWATAGDEIRITQLTSSSYTVTNATDVTSPPVGVIVDPGPGSVTVEFTSDDVEADYNSIHLALPPLTWEQISTNNPQMGQMTERASEGCYLVHNKMRRPVFNLTPASSFGTFRFTYPGYSPDRDLRGRLGIRDSWDENMTTAVAVFRGMSHAQTLVTKTYQGWEGITALNTPMGQFAHTGAPKCQHILDVADSLSIQLSGVYKATDNAAGAVALLASNLLSKIASSEATQSVINNVANQAVAQVPKLLSAIPNVIGGIGSRIVNRIRARRARRRAR